MTTRFIAIGALTLAILATCATAQPPADEGFEVLYQSAATDEPLTCQGAVNLVRTAFRLNLN